jgi:membrane protein
VTLRRLPARSWLIIQRSVDAMIRTAGSRDAAQLAFFVLLAFPATLLLVMWGFSTALDDPEVRRDIVDELVDALPVSDVEGRREIGRLLDGIAAGAGGLGWFVGLTLLYSASGGIAALRHAVNEAWGTEDSRPYFQGKALDVGLVLLVAPFAIAALALNLTGLVPAVMDDRPILAGTLSVLLTNVVPLLLVFGLLVVLFRTLPAERTGLRAAWPGALVATLGLVVVQFAAQNVPGLFGDPGTVYGTIGGLLAVGFAVYFGAITIVFGAHVSAQLSLLATGQQIDAAIEAGRGTGKPVGRFLIDALRGLVVRGRPARRRE